MEFKLRHPDNPKIVATYGWDHALGFWVTIHDRKHGGTVRYDALQAEYDEKRPVLGVLDFFVMQGFLSTGEVDAGIAWLQGDETARPSRVARAAVEIISNLRSAAD